VNHQVSPSAHKRHFFHLVAQQPRYLIVQPRTTSARISPNRKHHLSCQHPLESRALHTIDPVGCSVAAVGQLWLQGERISHMPEANSDQSIDLKPFFTHQAVTDFGREDVFVEIHVQRRRTLTDGQTLLVRKLDPT
jgi:hypothetical protein